MSRAAALLAATVLGSAVLGSATLPFGAAGSPVGSRGSGAGLLPGATGPAVARPAHPTVLIHDARIVDGTGAPAYRGSVRIHGDRVAGMGKLSPRPGERVVEAHGLVLAPGFVDPGRIVGRLPEDRAATAAVSRGVTTIVVGTRGRHRFPLARWFDSLRASPYAVNVASFAGLRTLRDAARETTTAGPGADEAHDHGRAAGETAEVQRVRTLLRSEMEAGALGLSVGGEADAARGPAAALAAGLRPDVEAAKGTLVQGESGAEPDARGWNVLPASLALAVREREGLSLEAAVHRLTESPALEVGIRGSPDGPRAGRGVIEPLAYADLVLLDPGRLADPDAGTASGGSFPGVVRVWVSGKEVFAEGRPTGARPGRVVRWPRM